MLNTCLTPTHSVCMCLTQVRSLHVIQWLSFVDVLHKIICFSDFMPFTFSFELYYISHFGAFNSWLCGMGFAHCWRSYCDLQMLISASLSLLWRVVSLAIIPHLLFAYTMVHYLMDKTMVLWRFIVVRKVPQVTISQTLKINHLFKLLWEIFYEKIHFPNVIYYSINFQAVCKSNIISKVLKHYQKLFLCNSWLFQISRNNLTRER